MDSAQSGVTGPGAYNYDVHIGFWINWTHGSIKSSTFTLSRENGDLLIVFLANLC